MTYGVDIEVPEPLRDCFLHSEIICVRDCCGIDAISQESELVEAWSRKVGHKKVTQALKQVEELIIQTEDRSHDVSSLFLNACTNGEIGRGELLSFLQAFDAALRSCPMNEVLTRAEMETQFEGEWVLIAEPEMDENQDVRRGRVVFHGKDREAMYDCDDALQLKKAAYLYLGPMPEMSVLLFWS